MLKRHPSSLDKASIMAINKLLTPRQRLDLVEFLVHQQQHHYHHHHQPSLRTNSHRSQVKRSSSLSDENFSTDENDNNVDDHHRHRLNHIINSDIMSLKYKRKASFAKSEPVSFVKLVNSNRLSMRNNKHDLDFQHQMGSCSEENISLDDDSSSSGYSIKAPSTKSSASGSNYDLEAAFDNTTAYPSIPLLASDGLKDEFLMTSMDDLPDAPEIPYSCRETETASSVSYQDQQMVSQILNRLLTDKGSCLPQSESRGQSMKKAVSLSDLDKLAEMQASFKSMLNNQDDNCEEITVTIPSLFTDFKAPFERSLPLEDDDPKFVNLIKTDNGLLEFCPSEFDQKEDLKVEPAGTNDHQQTTGQLAESPDMFNFTEDDHHEILDQLERKRQSEKDEEETEMQANWRKYLEKKSCLKRFRDELECEDNVDAYAYLNEIEMNVDYFQSELQELYDTINSSSYWNSASMAADTMLTFKSNRDAFNLRSYHNEIEMQRQLQTAFENDGGGEFADYDYEFEYDCEYECNEYNDYTMCGGEPGGGELAEENEEYEYQFEMEQESDSSVNSASGGGGGGNKKPLSAAQQLLLQMSVKPCVFKLNEGQCLKADCRFAHDFENITCKYWLDGVCFKGETCEFLHGIIEQDASQLAAAAVLRLKHQSRNRSSASFSSTGKGSSSSSGKRSKNKSRRSDSVENTKSAKTLEQDFKLEMEEFPPLGS